MNHTLNNRGAELEQLRPTLSDAHVNRLRLLKKYDKLQQETQHLRAARGREQAALVKIKALLRTQNSKQQSTETELDSARERKSRLEEKLEKAKSAASEGSNREVVFHNRVLSELRTKLHAAIE